MTQLTRRSLLAATTAMAAVGSAPSLGENVALAALAGKSFLITGCSSGFGRAGALHYARLGAKVFATMRNLPRAEAVDLRTIATAEKLDITVLPLDVRDEGQVNAAIAAAEQLAGGTLDVVVNNAGVVIGGPVELHDLAVAQLAFDTNVLGPQRVIRAVLPAMRARKAGLIVNISSQQGRFVLPGGGLYAATKFALEALSEQLAYELAPHGIEVFIVEPGGYPTSVGINRARYQQELAARTEPARAAAYPEMAERLKAPAPTLAQLAQYARSDPLDIPRAIAEVAAMPAGTRPLRRAVHPVSRPQEPINAVSREVQLKLTENSPVGMWVKAVHD